MSHRLVHSITAFFLVAFASAADVRSVSPISDTIVALYVSEGRIDQGITEQEAVPYITKLDTAAAALTSNYGITSEDDPRFATAQQPVKVGRKAKAADTLSLFRPEKFALDHWLYLVLPQPLTHGCTYTVTAKGFAPTATSITFLFHEATLRSESLHVNQVGFTPDAPKYAYLSQWMGDLGGANLNAFIGKPFHLVRVNDGSRAFTGAVTARKDNTTGAPQTSSRNDGTPFSVAKRQVVPKNFTEADVLQCDFSTCTEVGEYRVVVDGLGCSFPFLIDADAYRRAYYLTSRALFTQRSGIEKEFEPGLLYPRDHHPDDGRNAFQYDKNWRFMDQPNHDFTISPTAELKLWGWYHDAGDWDGYPSHVGVPFSLLLLYDLCPESFADGQVPNRYRHGSTGQWIEEGKDGLPDLLDEASWLIQFYRRARTIGKESGVTTGGVPGGYSGVDSCAGGASWKDTRPLKFSAEDPQVTYQYAACAAWLATCLDKAAKGKHADSAAWLIEATSAYEWAKANTKPGDDAKLSGERMMAALCLYRATKDASYQTQFATDITQNASFQADEESWSSPNLWEYAAGIYALMPANFPGLDAALQATVKGKVIEAADREFIKTAAERGYRFGVDWCRMHTVGAFSTPILYQPAIAYKITGERKYLDVIHTSAAYFLGGNPMNMAWVTGLGQRAVKYPFHPDSWVLIDYNSKVYENEILPGYVPYGSCESGDIFAGTDYKFSGDEDFSRSSAYPDVDTWPLSETRFENRYSIMGSEFCLQQTITPSLFAYGFLCGTATKTTAAKPRPTVAVTFPKEADTFKTGGDIAITVAASESVQRVEYYANERYLGTSTAKPFAFTWHQVPAGAVTLTAKAFDAVGQISRPNDASADVDVGISVTDTAPTIVATKLVILNPPAKPLPVDVALPLQAATAPLNATAQSIVWTTSDAKIATVNSQGVVLTRAPGKATITATAGTLKASCAVTVDKPASSPVAKPGKAH